MKTIVLSDRPPVIIDEQHWPMIAHGHHEEYHGQFKQQADRITDLDLYIRRHNTDGRVLIYAVYDYATRWQGERSRTLKVGILCNSDALLCEDIRAVGKLLAEDDVDPRFIRAAVNEAIANLPPVTI